MLLTLICIALLGLAASTSSTAAATATRNVLIFQGGVQARTTIRPATCSAGPGQTIAVSLVDVGGWQSLVMSASAPKAGKAGFDRISLQGTGYKTNDYAIGVWSLVTKVSAKSAAKMQITGNGTAGSINVKLPLTDVNNASAFPPVVVSLKWAAGACAAS